MRSHVSQAYHTRFCLFGKGRYAVGALSPPLARRGSCALPARSSHPVLPIAHRFWPRPFAQGTPRRILGVPGCVLLFSPRSRLGGWFRMAAAIGRRPVALCAALWRVSYAPQSAAKAGAVSSSKKKNAESALSSASIVAKGLGMDISFRATKISQPTDVSCDIGSGNLPLVWVRGFEPPAS